MVAFPFWAVLWFLQPPTAPINHLTSNPGAFFMVAAAYPIVEEIVFRGAMQGYLIERIAWKVPGPVSSANAITSLAFAALHGIVWANFLSLLIFIPSLVYGYFRDKTGGLVVSIVIHIFYNAGFYLVTSR